MVSSIIEQSEITKLLDAYRLPESLAFGVELAPVMFRADYAGGEWQDAAVVPFADVPVNPASTALQFGQQAFEGMKAYQVVTPAPTLFRPEMNYQRFNKSARRLCMPSVPASLFADGLSSLTNLLQPFIPGGEGQSLYLRPTIFGLDPHFAVKSSERFVFLVLASPSNAYYSDPVRVLVERNDCRAAVGGTGAEKVGGNYGASLQAAERCAQKGFGQSLWLDPKSRCNVEELSAMNFMAVVDGELHTPALSGSILDGVTRASLLTLARHLGIMALESVMPIDELLGDIASGRCSEAFACGTGAIICPISAIGEADGEVFELPEVNRMAATLKSALLGIQEGRQNDSFGWVVDPRDSQKLAAHLERGGNDVNGS
jgi:branched-chain amino acid aminotransferase